MQLKKRLSEPNVAPSGLSPRIRRLLERDGPNCWLCTQPMLLEASVHPRAVSIDHVVERRNGGLNRMENYKLACRECNSKRHELFPHTNNDGAFPVHRLPKSKPVKEDIGDLGARTRKAFNDVARKETEWDPAQSRRSCSRADEEASA